MTDRSNPPRWRTLGLLLAAAGALAPQARAGCTVETVEMPVQMVGSRAVATVGINGTPVPLTVDSGAFFSMLTEAAAAQLKLPLNRNAGLRIEGLTGRVESSTTRVGKLQLLKGDIEGVDFIVGGNEPGAGTMGLMGRNLLSFADTEYDLGHGMLRFHFPNRDCARADMAYWAGTRPVVALDLETGLRDGKLPSIRARARLNGTEVVALFDTGAASLVKTRAARRAGVPETAMTRAGTVYGAGRGRAELWTADFEKFEIGGETVLHNKLRVADLEIADADMLLGIDFFLAHRLYVSKQQSKLYFTYESGTVFALNRGEAEGAEAAASGVPPQTAEALARRGAAFAARGNLDGALADLDRACALEPTSAALHAQRGTVLVSLHRPAQALADFDTALRLDPALADARMRRAWLRLQSHDRDGAEADLALLDRTLAPQSQARLEMASLYLRLDQPAQVIAQLNQWLPAHPHEAGRDVALNNRCRSRARLGIDLDAALDDCNDALDADEKNPTYLDSRGWVRLRLGQYGKALADFDRSIAVRPDNAWSLYGRALANARLAPPAQAADDLAAAKRVDPEIDRKAARAGLTAPPPPTRAGQ